MVCRFSDTSPLSDGLLAIVHEIAPSIEGIYALGYKEPEDSSGFSSPSKFKEIRILLFLTGKSVSAISDIPSNPEISPSITVFFISLSFPLSRYGALADKLPEPEVISKSPVMSTAWRGLAGMLKNEYILSSGNSEILKSTLSGFTLPTALADIKCESTVSSFSPSCDVRAALNRSTLMALPLSPPNRKSSRETVPASDSGELPVASATTRPDST